MLTCQPRSKPRGGRCPETPGTGLVRSGQPGRLVGLTKVYPRDLIPLTIAWSWLSGSLGLKKKLAVPWVTARLTLALAMMSAAVRAGLLLMGSGS